jgi:predicted nucleic acid-binding protein
MRALIDTDILLDVALKREPFFDQAAEVIRWANDDPGQIAVAWHSLSNLAYLVRPDARLFISELLQFIEVAPTSVREARQAIGFPMNDFEDAMQAAAALAFDALFIVTRNVDEYKNSPVPALTPAQFLAETGRI